MEVNILASGSSGNAYCVSDCHAPLLLEAGISFSYLQQRLDFGISSLVGCLVSHSHKDHCRAVKDLVRLGVDVYASAECIEAMGISNPRLHPVRAKEQFEIGTWRIVPFDAVHDVPCLGFLLASEAGEKAVYLSDSAYCLYRFQGLTHILIGVNYAADIVQRNVDSGVLPRALKHRLIHSHASLETVKGFLRANDLGRVQAIYLLHLSDGNADAERFKAEIQQVTGKPVYVA